MEWLIDAVGCSGALLRQPGRLAELFVTVVEALSLRPVGEPLWQQFPSPGGVTGLWLLSESHLCCHTFPESGYAAFNLYCCCPRPEFDWAAQLQQKLMATAVTVRALRRGGLLPAPLPLLPSAVAAAEPRR
jgi:S-adenosylmethionine decarboxylase